ncbi:phosphotransferase family protein [Phenylobacterium sp.]|uniref:phosphotransferase family protein n=1 Tax=Phenylobacterium sp. TaxID=1871053 RepID=UPI00271E9958|nr:aminoglycoside phosphotransferase family protein [Phenylobacterium sp.]MDO8800877.1 aminoglycoside phosphotransferase family protein [Phenylobacterium sp.]
MSPRAYSARLGEISDAQFQQALDRLGLGEIRQARAVPFGLFGQNVFLTTSRGEFIFRGAQHGDWQFAKEVFFARLLAEHTTAPVAWPQWLETSPETFGWPYILAPRLPGLALADPQVIAALSMDDRLQIARAQGETLAALQALTWAAAGDFDLAAGGVVPFEGGHIGHLVGEVRKLIADADVSGSLTAEDHAWIEGVLDQAASARDAEPSVYLHNDFSLNNVLAERRDGAWAITGVVDLMTSTFGGGEADLCRQAANYLDQDPALTAALIGAYRGAGGGGLDAQSRAPLYVVYERLLLWEYFTRPPQRADWTAGKTFSGWARRYVDRLSALLRA